MQAVRGSWAEAVCDTEPQAIRDTEPQAIRDSSVSRSMLRTLIIQAKSALDDEGRLFLDASSQPSESCQEDSWHSPNPCCTDCSVLAGWLRIVEDDHSDIRMQILFTNVDAAWWLWIALTRHLSHMHLHSGNRIRNVHASVIANHMLLQTSRSSQRNVWRTSQSDRVPV